MVVGGGGWRCWEVVGDGGGRCGGGGIGVGSEFEGWNGGRVNGEVWVVADGVELGERRMSGGWLGCAEPVVDG